MCKKKIICKRLYYAMCLKHWNLRLNSNIDSQLSDGNSFLYYVQSILYSLHSHWSCYCVSESIPTVTAPFSIFTKEYEFFFISLLTFIRFYSMMIFSSPWWVLTINTSFYVIHSHNSVDIIVLIIASNEFVSFVMDFRLLPLHWIFKPSHHKRHGALLLPSLRSGFSFRRVLYLLVSHVW